MCRRSYLQNEQKERSWREVLQRSAAGGLNIHEFCRSEDLKETAFYFWKRMIAEGDREKRGVRRSAKSGRRSRREQNRKATAPAAPPARTQKTGTILIAASCPARILRPQEATLWARRSFHIWRRPYGQNIEPSCKSKMNQHLQASLGGSGQLTAACRGRCSGNARRHRIPRCCLVAAGMGLKNVVLQLQELPQHPYWPAGRAALVPTNKDDSY